MEGYYLDTSALIKHYHAELGSPEVDRILGEPDSEYLIARLTLTETVSVLARRVRTGEISDADFDRLRLRFFADVAHRLFVPVRMLNAHFDRAGEMIARHGKAQQIRALDALQLSAALLLPPARAIDHFVCADRRLCEVATLEGLDVLNPESL